MPDPKPPPRVEETQAVYDPAVAGVHAVQQLEQSGFARPQADAVVVAVRELAGDLATKADLAITKSELRAEISELRSELKSDLAELRGELKSDLARLETRMNKNALRNTLWGVGLTAGIVLAGMGVVTAILLAALPS